jgi:hypothetical protein
MIGIWYTLLETWCDKSPPLWRQIMNGRLAIVVLLGVAIGLYASSFLKQSEAQGQVNQEKQEWEYQVESFRVGEGMDKTHARIISGLASEGWEYVGLIGAGPVENRSYSVGNVLFKRLKK